MTLISAAEARKRSGKTVFEYLEEINSYILAATERGKHFIILHGDYERWMYDGVKPGSVEEKVIVKLRDVGYRVTEHYVEKQFVDMGLKISWE